MEAVVPAISVLLAGLLSWFVAHRAARLELARSVSVDLHKEMREAMRILLRHGGKALEHWSAFEGEQTFTEEAFVSNLAAAFEATADLEDLLFEYSHVAPMEMWNELNAMKTVAFADHHDGVNSAVARMREHYRAAVEHARKSTRVDGALQHIEQAFSLRRRPAPQLLPPATDDAGG